MIGHTSIPCWVLFSVVLAACNASPKSEPKVTQHRLTSVQIFDLRTKCQAIVDKDVEELSIGVVENALTAHVSSHYNPITNHCYAEVLVTKNFGYDYPKTPNDYRSDALYDAQTREILLDTMQASDKRTAHDFTHEDTGTPFSEYEAVSQHIHLLMTQEDD